MVATPELWDLRVAEDLTVEQDFPVLSAVRIQRARDGLCPPPSTQGWGTETHPNVFVTEAGMPADSSSSPRFGLWTENGISEEGKKPPQDLAVSSSRALLGFQEVLPDFFKLPVCVRYVCKQKKSLCLDHGLLFYEDGGGVCVCLVLAKALGRGIKAEALLRW